MKLFVFVLISITSWVAQAALNPVSGTIRRTGGGVFINGDQSCEVYKIEAQNREASVSLPKLTTGDFITASGTLETSACIAKITSIDYVGLKKLLGYWYTREGILRVSGFNNLDFYPFESMRYGSTVVAMPAGDPISYRYSVTPSAGREWIVFLSDAKSTTFASLQFTKTNGTLKIFDSETGEPIHVLRLSKWGDLE